MKKNKKSNNRTVFERRADLSAKAKTTSCCPLSCCPLSCCPPSCCPPSGCPPIPERDEEKGEAREATRRLTKCYALSTKEGDLAENSVVNYQNVRLVYAGLENFSKTQLAQAFEDFFKKLTADIVFGVFLKHDNNNPLKSIYVTETSFSVLIIFNKTISVRKNIQKERFSLKIDQEQISPQVIDQQRRSSLVEEFLKYQLEEAFFLDPRGDLSKMMYLATRFRITDLDLIKLFLQCDFDHSKMLRHFSFTKARWPIVFCKAHHLSKKVNEISEDIEKDKTYTRLFEFCDSEKGKLSLENLFEC